MFGIRLTPDARVELRQMSRKRRIIAEECITPIALDKFPRGFARMEIMDQHGAWFSSAQKLCGEFESAKSFWAVDQHGIAGLKAFGQDLARITEQKIDIPIRFQPRL